MKRVIITIVTLLSFIAIKAQEDKVRFGAKGGLNVTSMLFNDLEISNTKVDIHLGVFVEIPFLDKLAVQPELIYSSQGFSYSNYGEDYFFKKRNNYNYLNIPVIIKYYLLKRFSLQAGPQVGFLINSYYETTFNTSSQKTMLNGIKSTDFAINFGLGYQLDSNWFFDTRYNLGFSNVLESYNEGNGLNQKHRVFQVSVGYKF